MTNLHIIVQIFCNNLGFSDVEPYGMYSQRYGYVTPTSTMSFSGGPTPYYGTRAQMTSGPATIGCLFFDSIPIFQPLDSYGLGFDMVSTTPDKVSLELWAGWALWFCSLDSAWNALLSTRRCLTCSTGSSAWPRVPKRTAS